MDPFDDSLPMSQLASEAFNSNPVVRAEGPTSFRAAFGAALPGAAVRAGEHAAQQAPAAAAPRPGATQVVHEPLRPSKHGKLINDPVHGCYRLDPAATTLFDTRQFQRLRRLKQLGLTYYVFPGASHNRFEHSLGVAHLAFKFANQLWQAQRAELDCDRGDIRVVELAGLCHDLGHGPFSHVFEREFLKRRGITGWEHEAMSARMLDHIVDDNAIDTISPQDIKRVKGLITAGHAPEHGGQGGGQDGGGANGHAAAPPQGAASLAPWLSEVVANGRNGVDVDKADYLQRDSLYCGVRLSCDFNRIMQFSRVIGGEICFKYSEYMGLHELFHARASMHRAVYTHKKAKAVEFMVVDALVEADKALRFTDRIWDPAQFSRLDDSILETVENLEALGRVVHVEDEDAAPLAAAQAIIARLRRRQLYKYVTDAPVPGEALERGRWAAPSAQDIVACHHGDGGLALRAEDIILQENKIDFSMRNRNPLDSVSFYDDLESAGKRSLRADQISSMVVASFEDMRLRCYSRNADPRYVAAVHRAFESWVHRRFGGQVATSTPAKPAREAAEAAPTLAAMETAAAGPAAAGAKRGRELTFEGQAEAAGARRARQ